MESRILSAAHAKQSGVDEPWGDGNEAWWDWYLSLADDDDGAPSAGAPAVAVSLPW